MAFELFQVDYWKVLKLYNSFASFFLACNQTQSILCACLWVLHRKSGEIPRLVVYGIVVKMHATVFLFHHITNDCKGILIHKQFISYIIEQCVYPSTWYYLKKMKPISLHLLGNIQSIGLLHISSGDILCLISTARCFSVYPLILEITTGWLWTQWQHTSFGENTKP